jgi:hypothetical protein
MEIKNRIWLGLGIVVATSTAFYAGTRQSGMDHDMESMTEEGGERAAKVPRRRKPLKATPPIWPSSPSSAATSM